MVGGLESAGGESHGPDPVGRAGGPGLAIQEDWPGAAVLRQELLVHAGALAIDLLGRGAQAAEDRLGERQRDLAFARIDDVRAGLLERDELADVGRAREDEDRRIQLAGRA